MLNLFVSRTARKLIHPQRVLLFQFHTSINKLGGGRIPDTPDSSGAPDGTIPTLLNQGVGKNFKETELATKGQELFNMNTVTGAFGTMDAPVLVPSSFPSRIVGCVGAGEREHELLWFDLKPDHKHMCEKCGQIFQLDLTPEVRKQYEEWKEQHPTHTKVLFDQYVKEQTQQK